MDEMMDFKGYVVRYANYKNENRNDNLCLFVSDYSRDFVVNVKNDAVLDSIGKNIKRDSYIVGKGKYAYKEYCGKKRLIFSVDNEGNLKLADTKKL